MSEIVIASISRAVSFLDTRQAIAGVLSIGNPNDTPPFWPTSTPMLDGYGERLRPPMARLHLDDVTRPDASANAPSYVRVVKGWNFLRDHIDSSGTLLIHCAEGRSRSTAFGLAALYYQRLDERSSALRSAAEALYTSVPNADPNPLILRFLGDVLRVDFLRYANRSLRGL